MADTSGLVTLKNTVKEYLMLTRSGKEHYNRIYQLAAKGLQDLHLFHLRVVNTIKRTPDSIGVIDYPDDFLMLIGVYRPIDGELISIVNKQDLVNTKTLVDGVETDDTDYGEGDSLDYGIYDYRYGSRGAKDDYYYYDDTTNRRFIINGTPVTSLHIKYVSSGLNNDDADIEYPAEASEALLSYIRYKDAFYDNDVNKLAIREYKEEYKSEVKKLRSLHLPTADQLRDMIYSTTTNAPRR
jgi:hypothetical protein